MTTHQLHEDLAERVHRLLRGVRRAPPGSRRPRWTITAIASAAEASAGQETLRVEQLFSEPRWVALSATHPPAARDTVAFRELWDEPFVAAPRETGAWRDHWPAADEREGRPVRVGAVTEQPDDWLNAIASGYGIALAPESAARFYARPGIAYRPATGVSPTRVGVAWAPADDRNPVVQDFVRCCLDLAGQACTPAWTGERLRPPSPRTRLCPPPGPIPVRRKGEHP